MGLTKSEKFSPEQNQLASLARVLGHPARIAILQYLFQSNTCIGGDLVHQIGLAQPTISQHLKELKSAGLIKGTIEGTSVCYCIDPEGWDQVKELLINFLNQESSNQSSCCEIE